MLTSELNNISKWLDNNRLIIILAKGKTESLLFGTAKRISLKVPMMFFFNETLINFANGYKYLGVWLDPNIQL